MDFEILWRNEVAVECKTKPYNFKCHTYVVFSIDLCMTYVQNQHETKRILITFQHILPKVCDIQNADSQ